MTTNLPLSIILEEDHLRRIWAKGRIIPDFDPNEWRWDHAGRVMQFNNYGNRQSDFGWEKGHIIADALGGVDDISNLRPENWRTNAGHGGLLSAALAKRG